VVILLLASLVWACSGPSPTPLPEPSPTGTPAGGQGWTLLRTISPSTSEEGLGIAALGPDEYVVSITVKAGGSDGCNTPTLAGFERSRTTLVAGIVRSPTPANEVCATASTVTFYVALDRVLLSSAIVDVAVSDDCPNSPCPAPVQVPRP
jgi:hypothetical protein